jgi:hypothetical protein
MPGPELDINDMANLGLLVLNSGSCQPSARVHETFAGTRCSRAEAETNAPYCSTRHFPHMTVAGTKDTENCLLTLRRAANACAVGLV